MGIPFFASSLSTLTDMAVVRQSERFKACRLKLAVRLQKGLIPCCVLKSYNRFKSTSRSQWQSYRYFGHSVKESAVKLRDTWVRNNSNLVVVTNESFESLRTSLLQPSTSKYGFRYVYPIKRLVDGRSQIVSWSARVPVWKSVRSFPLVDGKDLGNICELVSRNLPRNSESLPKGNLYLRVLRTQIRLWTESRQFLAFSRQPGRKGCSTWRQGWFHDPLLHSLKCKGARVIRKLRLGVSRLRCHTYFLAGNDKNCPNCGCIETVNHFFTHCPSYAREREELWRSTHDILRSLKVQPTCSAFLGFIPGLESQSFEKRTRRLRRQLLTFSAKYIVATHRFHQDFAKR